MLTMCIFQILDRDSMGIGDGLVPLPLEFSGPIFRHKLLNGDHNKKISFIESLEGGNDILEY
jgi:hypothetical protein